MRRGGSRKSHAEESAGWLLGIALEVACSQPLKRCALNGESRSVHVGI